MDDKNMKTHNMLAEYAEKKKQNDTFDLRTYVLLNTDIRHTNGARHWALHGRHEARLCALSNAANVELWGAAVKPYLRHTQKHGNINAAFVVTTCVRLPVHLMYLTECLKHIRHIYPQMHIYVIDDNSVLDLSGVAQNNTNLEIVPSLVKGGGEINPYLFILDPRCKHDKLIFIHDTVFLKRNIDAFIARRNEIDFLWDCDSALYNDTFVPENEEILHQLFFYSGNTKMSIFTFIHMIRKHVPFTVKFGAMAAITRQFMQKVALVTNFLDISHFICKRVHRCFFERLISYMVIFIHGQDYCSAHTLCGSITKHPFEGKNLATHIPKFSACMIKVWQGR